MNNKKFKGYIIDSITLLKEQAREAKKDADNPKEGFEDYNKGAVMAYCSAISLLKHQAFAFNIDEKELGLDTWDHLKLQPNLEASQLKNLFTCEHVSKSDISTP